MYNNPTTFTKVLTGIQNTLNIANKVMPLYKETKPIISTFSKTYKNIKNNKNELTNILKIINNNKRREKRFNISPTIIKNKSYNNYNNTNNPTFFI